MSNTIQTRDLFRATEEITALREAVNLASLTRKGELSIADRLHKMGYRGEAQRVQAIFDTANKLNHRLTPRPRCVRPTTPYRIQGTTSAKVVATVSEPATASVA